MLSMNAYEKSAAVDCRARRSPYAAMPAHAADRVLAEPRCSELVRLRLIVIRVGLFRSRADSAGMEPPSIAAEVAH
jgi:hypothetical protein